MEDPQAKKPGYVVKLISGNANSKLARDIAKELGTDIAECEVGKFSDGEIKIQIKHNVRGADAFVIQPTCGEVNNNLMELLLLLHTLKLSSAKRITAVVPYFGYARQDRKTRPRVPISASAVAQLIEAMGPHRLVTLDLHCGQIQGFFHETPVDNLFAEVEFIGGLKKKLESDGISKDNVTIVSPDAGGVLRARRIADQLGVAAVVTILKRRQQANTIESMQIVGHVEDKHCIIVDDIIDTAGTLCKAAEMLKDNGARSVLACASHGIFSGNAIERINNSVLEVICIFVCLKKHFLLRLFPHNRKFGLQTAFPKNRTLLKARSSKF
ncbi:putative phosphoribosylpyrophosphate synthetase, variant 2 [Balamuthia mandrillaris]